MSSEFTVKVGDPIGRNEESGNSYRLQEVDLQNEDLTPVMNSEAYLPASYYSVRWITELQADVLVDLIEKTLQYYEQNYKEGVRAIDGKTSLVSGEDVDMTDPDIVGIISYPKNKDDDRTVLEYERPLLWKNIQGDASEADIVAVRLNTPIADFFIEVAEKEGFNFSFISHLAEMNGFAELVEESSSGEINLEKATEFFDAMVALFNHEPSKT